MMLAAMLPLAAAALPVVVGGDGGEPALSAPGPEFAPPQRNGVVSVMVELQDKPAAVVYAEAVKAAAAKAGGTFEGLEPAVRTAVAQSAAALSKAQAATIEVAQQAILPTLESMSTTGSVVFRVKSAYNGVSLYVDRSRIAALRALPGVKAVHVQIPKFQTATQDIDFLGARVSWTKTNPTNPYGVHGEGVKVAIIDSGLDYLHTNFGGPGTPAAYSAVTDIGPVPNPWFPSLKVPGGYDFAGDTYTGATSGPGSVAHPDANPLDSSNGHGTACASLVGGVGVAADGSTFVGVYDNATDLAAMKIAPGFAPRAQLYPLRVFGVTGSTNLVVQAIDWAVDPNGDGTLTDHMDVISMSLGANGGDPADPDDIAATNAAEAGVLVVSAAGNAGDSYFIVSSPSVANKTLSVAASYNNNTGIAATVTANSPPAIAGGKYPALYGSSSPVVVPGGITADVAYANEPAGNHLACSALTAGSMTGKVCMADRGTCTFATKIANCEAAGAAATLIVNNTTGALAMTTSVSANPALSITQADGALIKAQLAVPATVNVSIADSPPADTVASYSARGPRTPDAMLKPDITAPAESVGVATSLSGNAVQGFNGTSSATPHVSGIMALLRQLRPTWSVEELMALAMNTATHDLWTLPGGTGSEYGAGRVGGGRIDVANAVTANAVAYNNTDRGLVSVSFGIVEVPVAGSKVLTKQIAVVNKGAAPITYNLSYADDTPVAGAAFTVGVGPSITVPAGGTVTVPVTFTGTGNLLKHVLEASVPLSLPSARQWLTEKTGYAVFTPTGGTEPVLRVALYAAPKPVSAMHATAASVSVPGPSGTTNISLAGTGINTGAAPPVDIISFAKPFELQYTGTAVGSTDPNVLKHVGVTSDYPLRATKTGSIVTFALEGFGAATVPSFQSSDKEIYIDLTGDGNPEYAIYLSSSANGTAASNVYIPIIVNLSTSATSATYRTDGFSPASYDVNAYRNDFVTVPVPATAIGLVTGGLTKFRYYVETYDREGNTVDSQGWLTYDLANPGLDVQGGNLENFFYTDAPGTVPVGYNFANIAANGSLGVLVAHMHNGNGSQSDVVTLVQTFHLTVAVGGAGTGTVTSAPTGINCPATACGFDFDQNQLVTLTAAATGTSAFTGWSGADGLACGTVSLTCNVTMSAARSVTATFQPTYLLTVAKSGNGTGTVQNTLPLPALTINCGAACAATYVSGTAVTLHAIPDAGQNFIGWSDPGCPGVADCVVSMSGAKTVTATFTDTTPPNTSITGFPVNPSLLGPVSFTFTSTEPGSTFLCSLDGAPQAACTSPANYNVGAGPHTFTVAARDAGGNVDPSPASYSWVALSPFVNQIPTLYDWMLVVLALMLGTMGIVAVRRRAN